MNNKPAPPKIAPKPGFVIVVRAMYAYEAQQEDELSFNEGDILYITTEPGSDKAWWKARCGTKSGLIPSNYVELKMDSVDNPIHDASRRGNIEFLQECLKNGVSATGLDASGNTPLHWAAKCGHFDCVKELLDAGIKQFQNPKRFINIQNKLGDTPLHLAASKDHVEITTLLLENGSDPRIMNKDKQSPLDLCHEASTKSILHQWFLHPNENEAQDGDEYLEGSEGEAEDEGIDP